MSWPLPSQELRSSALSVLLLGVIGTTGLAWFTSVSNAYTARSVVVFSAIALLVFRHVTDHPFRTFGAANATTTARAVLVSLVAGLAGEPSHPVLATSASVAAVTLDGVDGWLARRTGTASAFGARFDVEIDALLVLALAMLAWQYGKAGWWIVLAGLMRYLFVAAGYGWSWLNATLPPSLRRKAACVVQIVGLSVVVSPIGVPPTSTAIAAATLMALSYSFLVDIIWLRRHGG